MVMLQMRANATTRDLDARVAEQQTITRDAMDAKASIRGMQIGIRDLRLAGTTADMQKANDYLAARLKSVDHFTDEMLEAVQVGREPCPHREAEGEGGGLCQGRPADRGRSHRSDRLRQVVPTPRLGLRS